MEETFAYDGLNRQVSRLISGTPPTPPDPTPIPTATPVATATPQGSPTPPPTEQCKEVTFSGTVSATMQTATAGATIFYTKGGSNVVAPTHNGPTPTGITQVYTGPVAVPFGQVKTFKALAYHENMADSKVTSYVVDRGDRFSSQSMIPPSSETFYYVYDGWTLIAEYPNNVFDYPTAYLPGIKNLTTNQYYYHDGLGSVTHLANDSGHLIEWYRYDLQGETDVLQLSWSATRCVGGGKSFSLHRPAMVQRARSIRSS